MLFSGGFYSSHAHQVEVLIGSVSNSLFRSSKISEDLLADSYRACLVGFLLVDFLGVFFNKNKTSRCHYLS